MTMSSLFVEPSDFQRPRAGDLVYAVTPPNFSAKSR
jgi:hypothetical protein